MSATTDKLNYLSETKAAIKEAIENKGVTVSDSDTFRSYAEKIGTIETGGDGPFVSSSEDIPIYEDNIIVLPRFAEKGEGTFDPPCWGRDQNANRGRHEKPKTSRHH